MAFGFRRSILSGGWTVEGGRCELRIEGGIRRWGEGLPHLTWRLEPNNLKVDYLFSVLCYLSSDYGLRVAGFRFWIAD